MSNSSRTGTPQPWAGANSLQLPQAPKGKGAAGARSTSQEPDGGEATGGGGGGGKATNVNSLMDAVGASGVDLGAEEESLRASNERAHAQAMAAASASAQGSAHAQAAAQHAYKGIDRSRKQDFIDPSVLAECVKKVAAAFQLKTLEPDTIPLIALATRHRLQSLINASISARDHRHASSHFKVPPLVVAQSSSLSKSNKRRRTTRRKRRDPVTGDLMMDVDSDGLEEEEEDDDDDDDDEDDDDNDNNDDDDEEGASSKRPKVAAWDALVYDDPERYLTVLERVDRAEETKARKERMVRDEQDQRERDQAEEMYAAELAKRALEDEDRENKALNAGGGGGGGGGGGLGAGAAGGGGIDASGATSGLGGGGDKGEGKGKGKAKNAADRFLASNQPEVPSTPTKELGKDGKPKKKKKPKAGQAAGDTPGGAGGGPGGSHSTPGPSASGTSTPSATSIAKNMSEDVRKRLTDSSAMKSLGGTKYSWMNAGGIGSPSPSTSGVSSFLGKPKFAPANSFGTPGPGGLGGGGGGLSSLNPANNAPVTANSSTLDLVNALTTSRLNVPQLHDSQRTQIAKDQWEAGHHVVEVGDLLFAMDRERGAGVGKGSGRNVALRGRAGITRGGYRGGGAVGR